MCRLDPELGRSYLGMPRSRQVLRVCAFLIRKWTEVAPHLPLYGVERHEVISNQEGPCHDGVRFGCGNFPTLACRTL